MSQRTRFLFPLTAIPLILSGCAGAGGTSLNDGGTSGTSGSGSNDSPIERTASGAATSGHGTAQTVSTAGAEIKAMDMPVGGEFTSGTGEMLIASSDSISAFSTGMDEGLGNYRENDNFLGTTFAGGAMSLSEGGETIAMSGEMIKSMNDLPVFMQVDESSGFVTAMGGTVSDLGVTIRIVGDEFAAEMSDENSTFGGGTAFMSAVLQPVLIMTEDGVGRMGDALLIGPAGSEMLDKSAGLMIQGAETFGSFDPRLAGPEQMMVGGAQMVSAAGSLLTNGGQEQFSVGVPEPGIPGNEFAGLEEEAENAGVVVPAPEALEGEMARFREEAENAGAVVPAPDAPEGELARLEEEAENLGAVVPAPEALEGEMARFREEAENAGAVVPEPAAPEDEMARLEQEAESAGETLTMMAGKISQTDVPMDGGVTSGTGEVLSGGVSFGVSAFLNAFGSVVVPLSAPFDQQMMMGSLPGAGEFSEFEELAMSDASFSSVTAPMDELTGSFPEAGVGQLQGLDGGQLNGLDGGALPIGDLSSLDEGQLEAAGLSDLGGALDESSATLTDAGGELDGTDSMEGTLSGLVGGLSGGAI